MRILLISALVVFVSINSAKAENIYYFGGILSDDWGTLTAGTPFNGSFSYSYPQAPTPFPFGDASTYSLSNFSITIGPENPELVGDSTARVWNYNLAYPYDSFLIRKNINNSVGGRAATSVAIWLVDPSGTWLSSSNLPESLNLETFDSTKTGFYIESSNGNLKNTLTYLVPEPSALSLLAVGLGVVLRRRRRTV